MHKKLLKKQAEKEKDEINMFEIYKRYASECLYICMFM